MPPANSRNRAIWNHDNLVVGMELSIKAEGIMLVWTVDQAGEHSNGATAWHKSS